MEIENLFGLPAHPLLVHVPVVLIPIAGLMALAMAIRPVWFARYGWWLVAVTGVGALGAILAAGSGEELEGHVQRSAALADHAELGETARTISIVFFLVVVAIKLFQWWTAREAARSDSGGRAPGWAKAAWVPVVAAVLLAVSGIASTYAVVKAGHQGAKLTWSDTAKEQGGGDHDGD